MLTITRMQGLMATAGLGFALFSCSDPEVRSDLFSDEASQAFFMMVRETLIGLALGRATNGGRPVAHEATVLETLERLAHEHDARLANVGHDNAVRPARA